MDTHHTGLISTVMETPQVICSGSFDGTICIWTPHQKNVLEK